MMRIAYLCADFGIPIFSSKGAAVHVRELARAFASLGCDVHILAPRLGGPPPDGWAIPIHPFDLDGWPAGIQDFLAQDAQAAGWERMDKDFRALAYAQTLSQAALPLLERLKPDVLYERYSLFAWAGRALSARLEIPHIIEMNAPLAAEQARYRRLALSRTAAGLEQRILNGADRVAAVSKAVRDHVVGLGVLPGRVEVLPNGVDIDRFHPTSGASPVRRELGLDQAFVIGFVGGLKAWHGVDGLLDACAGLPGDLPWRLLLVGDGPLRDALTRQAAALGISRRVIFTGALPYDQVPVTLAAFDVAVAPYPALDDFYFSPLKLFEYMAMARPVVASNLGQIAEVVAHGQTGWLVPPGDVEALRGALAHLASDPDLRGRLGAAARLYVSAQHTWVANAQRILSWVSGLSGVGSLDRVSGLGQPVTGDRPPGWAGGAEP